MMKLKKLFKALKLLLSHLSARINLYSAVLVCTNKESLNVKMHQLQLYKYLNALHIYFILLCLFISGTVVTLICSAFVVNTISYFCLLFSDTTVMLLCSLLSQSPAHCRKIWNAILLLYFEGSIKNRTFKILIVTK